MMMNRLLKMLMLALTVLVVASCGGGSGTPTGTLRVSLTDTPACGYDHVWVTVSAVRVHRNSTAGDNDGGWIDLEPIDAASPSLPMRIDLLTLTNGALAALGRATLPVGHYSQLRLVLSPNRPNDPTANAVVLTGSTTEIPLDTPSGTQSGLKLNVGFDVAKNQTIDVVLDFDASKSVVRLGGTGAFNLKPVIRAVPIVSSTGMRVEGYVPAALGGSSSRVSLQANGVSIVATPADDQGKFVLYPVPEGTYDLVVTSPTFATATITGVPASNITKTTIGTSGSPIQIPSTWPTSSMGTASGSVAASGNSIDAIIAAKQQYSAQSQPDLPAGPRVVIAECMVDGSNGNFSLSLPDAAPFLATFVAVAGSSPLPYTADLAQMTFNAYTTDKGRYTLSATSGGVTQSQDITAADGITTTNVFTFP